MDTKTLVVGQTVYMSSGVYGCKGKVIKITPLDVEVQIGKEMRYLPTYPLDGRAQGRSEDDPVDWDSWNDIDHSNSDLSLLLRFNNAGEGCDGLGTFECGPWHISRVE
jgi:hypothetical protein